MADHHVVIIGGGFGGLAAARALRRAKVRITLLDRTNHHLFQPLLYQVATSALSAPDIAAPIRHVLRHQRNVRVLLANATSIEPNARIVHTAGGALSYDYLVVATGVTHAYFGHDDWKPHAPGLKVIEDAFEIRRRIFLAYESAERETNLEARRAWMTFAVVGGGPTGVELAGALAEIAQKTLVLDFRHIDPAEARVILLEGGDRVLSTFPENLSRRSEAQLRDLGVEVRTNARVSHIDSLGLAVGAERIDARTVLWAAGVQGAPLARSLGVPLDDAGRVRVESDLSIPNHPEVFVVGDLAAFEQDGAPIPGVAPAAVQEGKHAALNIRHDIDGHTLRPFRYRNKGTMATIGRSRAVAVIGRLQFWGWPAWLVWLVIHIFFLVGFRNRVAVLLEWAYAYVTYKRSARLIYRPHEPGCDEPSRPSNEEESRSD